MGKLRELQDEIVTDLNAVPALANSCVVSRHGDLASEVEQRCGKYKGRAVILRLRGLKQVSPNSPQFITTIRCEVWTRNQDQSGEATPVYGDDLVEEIIKQVHQHKNPEHVPLDSTKPNSCLAQLNVTDVQLVPVESEPLRSYTLYVLTIEFETFLETSTD